MVLRSMNIRTKLIYTYQQQKKRGKRKKKQHKRESKYDGGNVNVVFGCA